MCNYNINSTMGIKCMPQYTFELQGSLRLRRVGRSLIGGLRNSDGNSSVYNSSSRINLCIVYILCRNPHILMTHKICFILHIHCISRSFLTLRSTSLLSYSSHFYCGIHSVPFVPLMLLFSYRYLFVISIYYDAISYLMSSS